MNAFNPGILAAWGHAGGGPGWGWNMMGGWGGWGGWMGGPLMILIWVLVILAVVYGVRSLIRSGRDDRPASAPPRRSALELLEERYARGELEREQYLAMRRDLGG